jgi:hypothetical protein
MLNILNFFPSAYLGMGKSAGLGVLECWSIGVLVRTGTQRDFELQYSITPLLHYYN